MLRHRAAHGRVGVEQQQPVHVVGQLELSAEHSMPFDSTPRSSAAPMALPPGSVEPTRANGALIPTATFGAPHTTWTSAGAVVDHADRQAVRLRMTSYGEHLRNDDAVERRTGALDRLDLEPGARQVVGHALRVAVERTKSRSQARLTRTRRPSCELLEET